jgi:hypothetical protein
MIIIDMLGVMYVWNIQLNAITVVNIVMVGVMKRDRSSLDLVSSRLESQWNSVHTSHVTFLLAKVKLDWNGHV